MQVISTAVEDVLLIIDRKVLRPAKNFLSWIFDKACSVSFLESLDSTE